MQILYGEEFTEEEVQQRLYNLYHSHERPSQDSELVMKSINKKKINQDQADRSTSITINQTKNFKKTNQQIVEKATSITTDPARVSKTMNQQKVGKATSVAIDQAKVSKTMNQQPQQGGGDDVSCLQKKSVTRIKIKRPDHKQLNMLTAEEEEEEMKKKKHLQFLIDLDATCAKNNIMKPPSQDIDHEEETKKKHLEEEREEVAFSLLKKKVAEVSEEHRDRVLTAIYHQGRSSMEELLLVVNNITNQENDSEKKKINHVTKATPSTIIEEKSEKVNLGNSATSVRATQEASSKTDYEKKLEATRIKLANQYKEARERKERKQIQVIKHELPPAVLSSGRTITNNKRKRSLMAAPRRNKQPPRIVKMRVS